MKSILLFISALILFACSNNSKKIGDSPKELIDDTEALKTVSSPIKAIDTSKVSITEFSKKFDYLLRYQKTGLDSDLKVALFNFQKASSEQPNVAYYQIMIGLIYERLNSLEAANSSYEIAKEIAEKNLVNPWPMINLEYGVGNRAELNAMINEIPDQDDINTENIIRSIILKERMYLLGAKILLQEQDSDLHKFKSISTRNPAVLHSTFIYEIENRNDFFKLIDGVAL